MIPDTATPVARFDALDPDLHTEWAALAVHCGVGPFGHPDWSAAWAAMRGIGLAIATLREDGALTGAYPLLAAGRRVASAADWHVPHLDPAATPETLPRLAAAIVAGRRRVRIDFCAEPAAAAFREAMRGAGMRVRERVRMRSPWVDLGGGWDRYRDSLPSHKWREIRRRRRRLDELGTVTFACHDGSADLDRLLEEGFAVEGAGWKGADGTAMASDAAVAAFYRRVAGDLARRDMLRLRFLRLDGRAIAFDLAFVHDDAEWLLKTGFDPALFTYSPGSLLRAEAIEQACAAGCTRYEFLGTDDPWKLEWTERTRPVVLLDGFAPGMRGRVEELAGRIARRVGVGVRSRTRRPRRRR